MFHVSPHLQIIETYRMLSLKFKSWIESTTNVSPYKIDDISKFSDDSASLKMNLARIPTQNENGFGMKFNV